MKMTNFFGCVALASLALLFTACGNPQPKQVPHAKAYPSWYIKKELISHAKYEVIGYGNAKTIKEAKANAKESIALTLLTRVDSSFKSSSSNDSSSSEAKLKVTSRLSLQNLKTLKEEYRDGEFFVALMYENLDLAHRIKKTLGRFESKNKEVNSYISKTPLFSKITETLGSELNFKLDRRNSAWYLKYREELFLLNGDEFEELFVNSENESFEFKSSKNVLLDGDSFYFRFNTKQDGYITLLNVYENGVVTLLQPSHAIKNTLQIPSKKSENYFEAGVIKEGIDTYDLYVAIFTKKPLDMSRFELGDEDLASNELAYKFDELIEFMGRYKYSSILLRTKAK